MLNILVHKTRKLEKADLYRKTLLDIGSTLGTRAKLVDLEGKWGDWWERQIVEFCIYSESSFSEWMRLRMVVRDVIVMNSLSSSVCIRYLFLGLFDEVLCDLEVDLYVKQGK